MDIRPLTGHFGAEIFGADMRDPAQFEAIKAAFTQYSVIKLAGQSITPDDHLAFARRWGDINVNRFFRAVDTHPEIAEVLKEKNQKGAIDEVWHTDHSYDQIPALGSILHAIETPPYGGDTVFCYMAAAYDALSEPFKLFLKGLNAWHSSRHVFGVRKDHTDATDTGRVGNADKATQDALHPVVIAHPDTGRAALYTNSDFTTHFEGWTAKESRPLLDQIEAHATTPEFTCRVAWAPGTLTMWDNRAVMHKAINDYHGHRRLMHRITIEGAPLRAYSA